MTIDTIELIGSADLDTVSAGINWMTTVEKGFQWGASGAVIGAMALPVFPISSAVGGVIGAAVGATAGLGFGMYSTWNSPTRER